MEFIMRTLGNGFIALMNCEDWVKNRNISSSGSNPHCFENFQNQSDLFGILRLVDICADWKNVKSIFYLLDSD